jgi:asparagine synthase (glutamine-hydrolysing)
MRGIAGVFNYGSGRPVYRALVETMTCSLAHRGPDGEGFHFDASLALALVEIA